jgi:hypothetical protein
LTLIDVGNPDRITSSSVEGGLINFVKLRKTAEVIKHIQHFQQTGYNESQVPIIQEYLQSIATKNLFTEDQAYNRSLEVEPRQIV